MKKVYYYFGECGTLVKTLTLAGIISLAVSAVLFFKGGWEVLCRSWASGNNTYAIWCAFFLLLGVMLIIINICIHKICRDVATLLKEIEDKKTK